MDWMLGVPVEQNQGLCGLQLELIEKTDSIFSDGDQNSQKSPLLTVLLVNSVRSERSSCGP